MKQTSLLFCLILILISVNSQTLSTIQMQNARATGYAIIASRNPGVSFSVLMIPWDGINSLEYNAQTQINSAWHAQAVIKGNFFHQGFDGIDFTSYSSVLLSQEEFDSYKSVGTQWWIACSNLPPFSNSSLNVTSNGKVGVGTTTPSQSLSIVGSLSLENEPGNSAYTRMYMSYTGYNNANPHLIITPSTTPGSGIVQSSLFLRNSNGNSASSNNTMNLLIDGKLSIGTTELTEKLSVNGNIRAKKLIVSQQNWSDYVFDKDYKLRPLNELEKFIQQYQHLPDVPSTKEVQSKGINVGDTQALLLKKIEELTLYVIELKKENLTQQQEINDLKKKKSINK
jgi:hypothetical protein